VGEEKLGKSFSRTATKNGRRIGLYTNVLGRMHMAYQAAVTPKGKI